MTSMKIVGWMVGVACTVACASEDAAGAGNSASV